MTTSAMEAAVTDGEGAKRGAEHGVKDPRWINRSCDDIGRRLPIGDGRRRRVRMREQVIPTVHKRRGDIGTVLRGIAASASFGGLLFLTVLLATSPWAGADWAPSPGLSVGWMAAR